jgi:hypothetical protein
MLEMELSVPYVTIVYWYQNWAGTCRPDRKDYELGNPNAT